MSRTIHGLSHKAIASFREKSASLAVYWIYVSRMNNEGVAWPSSASLAKTTDWNKAACLEGRAFLVTHQALERVEGYVRPDWRKLDDKALKRKLSLDRAEYYRPTGYILLGEDKAEKYWLLYNGGDEESDIDSHAYDGKNHRPSAVSTVGAADSRPNQPELDSSLHLDSSFQLDSKGSFNFENQFKSEPEDPNARMWLMARGQLAVQLDSTNALYVRDTTFVRVEEGIWVIRTPSDFICQTLTNRLGREIRRVLRDVSGSSIDVKFESEDQS